MKNDNDKIFEAFKSVVLKESDETGIADSSENTTAYKLGKVTSKLLSAKRRLELNIEAPETKPFSNEEILKDVSEALDILEHIKYPYPS